MDRQVFIAYLSTVAKLHEQDPVFFVTVYKDEIDTMKNWCKQNQYRYKYVTQTADKSFHFYEIFNS